MKFLLAAVFLLLTCTCTSAMERMPEEELDLILIDSPWEDTIEDSNHGERFERNAEGSGANDWDYGIDDEDHGEAGSSPDLVSSRTIPIQSSPIFQQAPSTRSSSSSTASPPAQAPPPKPREHFPRRPALTSQFPNHIGKVDGSGGGSDNEGGFNIMEKPTGDHNDTEFINPTRPKYVDPISITLPQPVETTTINHKPFVTKRLEKIALTAGKASRIIIPADTFQDLEDGDARDLVLKVVQFGTGYPMDDLGWIKFNPEEQEIIALPLEAEIGEYEFQVIATDKGGMFEREMLQIVVRQHSSVRNFHHSFEASLTMGSLGNFKHDIDWKLAILDDVVGYFGDLDPSSITVLSNRRRGGDIQFVWTNDTLSHQSCPKDSIEAIYGKMVNRKSGDVTPGFKSALKKNFYVKKVSLKMKGLCSTRGGGGVDTGLVTPRLPQSGFDNSMPQIRNPVDKLNITAGELIQYQVPSDMCFDNENGGTRDLNLQLLTNTQPRLEVPKHNWLQFDSKNQEFYGVPLEGDVGRDVYQLVCSDNQGLSAYDGIEVLVLNRPFAERFNLEFTFVFNDTLDDGNKLAESRVFLMKTIAKIFNDKDTKHIVLKSVDPDTLEVMWANKSLPVRSCPREWLESTKHRLMHKEGTVRQLVTNAFAVENFHLSDIKMVTKEACAMVPVTPDVDITSDIDPILDLIPSKEYLLTFVVPAIIIITMLLLAILIACLLHRKRKAGKLDMFKTEALPPRIPVIMQDELCEDNFNISKQPIILQEEPGGYGGYGNPPQYFSAGAPMMGGMGGGGPMGMGSMQREDDFNECDSLVNGSNGAPNLPYARPPPVALEFSDTLTRSRHRPAPAYRKAPHFNP